MSNGGQGCLSVLLAVIFLATSAIYIDCKTCSFVGWSLKEQGHGQGAGYLLAQQQTFSFTYRYYI